MDIWYFGQSVWLSYESIIWNLTWAMKGNLVLDVIWRASLEKSELKRCHCFSCSFSINVLQLFRAGTLAPVPSAYDSTTSAYSVSPSGTRDAHIAFHLELLAAHPFQLAETPWNQSHPVRTLGWATTGKGIRDVERWSKDVVVLGQGITCLSMVCMLLTKCGPDNGGPGSSQKDPGVLGPFSVWQPGPSCKQRT